MPRIVKAIKDKLTPHIYKSVAQHEHILTITWVSFVLVSLGFACALVLMYNHILILEQAVNVLGAKG
jgi:hypothetical protein